jgi:hypothetical protein
MAVPIFYAKDVAELEIVDAIVIQIKRDRSAIDFDGDVGMRVNNFGISGLSQSQHTGPGGERVLVEAVFQRRA